MNYYFDEGKFEETFNVKKTDMKSVDSVRLTHRADHCFKLFPYKASGKTQAPIVTELEDVVSGFFREITNKKTNQIEFEQLCNKVFEQIEIDEEDMEYFRDLLHGMFFKGDNFVATNLALYPYQISGNNKSVENLAHFLFSVFGVNSSDIEKIEETKRKYRFNVLEDIVINAIEKNNVDEEIKTPYFNVKNDVSEKFRNDFYYMLEIGMTALEDFANLFAIYYFYYVSQTCITLDQFCTGKRENHVPFYYALDWEKVSKNRMCCKEGWEKLQGSINHMFSHAITLEILNQTNDGNRMYDYITLGEMAKTSSENDCALAEQVTKARMTYCSYIGDYKQFDMIAEQVGSCETEKSIRKLYKCVEAQFAGTDRKRANQFYNEKFTEFCKSRWIKNRKKSGLVLNLTERDIIFLTKICLKNNEKLRLNELYKEYEYRGIYLDSTSKEFLQEFFTKLNLIDKKSDSGDAQYVKRIL